MSERKGRGRGKSNDSERDRMTSASDQGRWHQSLVLELVPACERRREKRRARIEIDRQRQIDRDPCSCCPMVTGDGRGYPFRMTLFSLRPVLTPSSESHSFFSFRPSHPCYISFTDLSSRNIARTLLGEISLPHHLVPALLCFLSCTPLFFRPLDQ